MMISLLEEGTEDVFDPRIHLAFAPPSKKFTFEDLSLQPSATSTKIAATLPFPILSSEGVRAYRRSLFSSKVLHNCAGIPFPRTLTLRNAAEHSSFIKALWNHPETMRVLSEAAGVPLRIVMQTEIGHTNIQTSGSTLEEMVSELSVEPQTTKVPLTEEERAYDPLKSSSIIPWHYDSYPYVCVIMLSDTDGMLGGETYIKTGDGVPMKVEGPSLGYGVILQGGEVEHLAARCMGVKERISTITSFCADVPGAYDSSHITNVRYYSDRPTLYKQWTEFRLEKMKREIDSLLDEIAASPTLYDVRRVQRFAQDQIAYLKRTSHQLVPHEDMESVIEKLGGDAIRDARKLWAKAEMLEDFNERVASVTPSDWMPGSELWIDLVMTQMAIQARKTIESQRGRFQWTKDRPFCMGDELLRQGLPEVFLSWLDASGLLAVVKS
ncbi:hypothetical protein, variant [Exophiala xenobiotica]|uniref:Fe2OG dioxygenase domain-containing protein n=1 Tax=Exophiala xenobiotica TaxID=348802 RepID=A0A0D2EWQ1_9EURO|nr:hypothetical protein, variant [Exophiala xenobiotica]XP_013312849.1 uncharacterized protein PV05_07916 [Exophiala xenobiotica]KIW52264.1 hypothetical protein PV05_07916 [Exophiala xenobiotica]KIW52265.1 hypothetical protein, variant [Exophiala xenobiotica]